MLTPNQIAPDLTAPGPTGIGARIETLEFGPGGWVPNSRLPVVLVRGALDGPADDGEVHALFRANGWGGTWTWTAYDFHHYHSTAHEALAVAQGEARLMLGGPGGRRVTVRAGDLIVLPQTAGAPGNCPGDGEEAASGARSQRVARTK